MRISNRRVNMQGMGYRWMLGMFALLALVTFVFVPSVVKASVWQSYTLTVVSGLENCWTSAELYPIAVGNYWTSIADGDTVNPDTETVLSTTKKINGARTSIIEDNGLLIYITNNQNGLRMHGSFSPDNDMGGGIVADGTMTFSPPMQMLNAVTCLGDHISSLGDDLVKFVGFPQVVAVYAYDSDVVAEESVSVPFGTFQAVRIDSTLTLSYPGLGLADDVFTDTTWYVPGIGPVKANLTDSYSSVPGVLELIDTNLTAVPEPSLAWMQFAALLGLGGLSRLRRRAR